MFALTATSTFIYALTLSTITRLIVYATTCAALPVLRFRKTAPEAKFLAPFGTAAAIASLILIVWLLANVKLIEFRDVAIAAAAGLVLCFVYRATTGKLKTEN
jgi:amino acid transporter